MGSIINRAALVALILVNYLHRQNDRCITRSKKSNKNHPHICLSGFLGVDAYICAFMLSCVAVQSLFQHKSCGSNNISVLYDPLGLSLVRWDQLNGESGIVWSCLGGHRWPAGFPFYPRCQIQASLFGWRIFLWSVDYLNVGSSEVSANSSRRPFLHKWRSTASAPSKSNTRQVKSAILILTFKMTGSMLYRPKMPELIIKIDHSVLGFKHKLLAATSFL